MKKFLIALLFIIIATNAWALGKRNNDFSVIETGLIYSTGNPNGWGKKSNNTFLEFQGTHRYGPLDLYWFVDFSNIFKTPKLSDKFYTDPDYIYGEINPRISLNWIFDADMSFLLFKEWFIAYNFDFDTGKNGGILKHYLGIGNDIDIPLFDYFKTNIYIRYVEQNYGRNEYAWDGYMFNMAYGMTIHKFRTGIKITYSSWLDFVFAARTFADAPYQTSDSIQWNNNFRITYKGVSLGYTYQVNHNYSEVNQNSSGNDSQSVGLYYSINF